MKRRTFIRNLAAGVAVPGTFAGATLPKPAFIQGKTEWKMVTQFRVNPNHEEFARIIEGASEGRLIIKLSSRGTEPPMKVIDDVGEGKIEMAWGNLLYSPVEEEGKTKAQKVPAATFLIMPFGLTAQEYNAWIEFGGGKELVENIYQKIGCKFFPAGNTGIQMGGWFAKEINTIDDLKGLKIRISGYGAAAMKAVGAEPYDVAPWSEDAKNALAAGKLEAFELGNPDSDFNAGLHKQYKFYYYPAWHEPSVPFDLIINLDKWEALPLHFKIIISTAARWLNYQWLHECTARATTALETLIKDHGVQLRKFPEAVLMELKNASFQIMREQASKDKLSQEVFDSIMLFKQKVSSWSNVSLQPFLTARRGL